MATSSSLVLLLLACLLNKTQFYSELQSVMPMLSSNSSLLDDINDDLLHYLICTNFFSFYVVAFLPIPLVRTT
jgi:hypothetical protein